VKIMSDIELNESMETIEISENIQNKKRQEEESEQPEAESTASVQTCCHLYAVLICPCCYTCIPRILEFLEEHKKYIRRGISSLTFLWTLFALWSQFLAFRIPDYQVGSAYEGGDSFLFAHGLWLDERAIIFSPADINKVTNSSDGHVNYMASGSCRTFSGCLYDGEIYPTNDDGGFHRFGGSGNPGMGIAMWIAIILLTAALLANEACRSIQSGLYHYFQTDTELAEMLNIGHYNEDDWELIWSFMKFWILSFFNCALTLPIGTTMIGGCLEAGGFFQLRHLITVAYIFVLSCGSFLFLLGLFLCNVKCFDEELGFGRLLLDPNERGVVEYDERGHSQGKRSFRSIFFDATHKVIKGNNKPFTCGCRQYQYPCFFTIGSYLQVVLGTLTFFGFLVFMVAWISGLMAIINGVIDDPLKNSGQLLHWWFDLFKYCMEKKRKEAPDTPQVASSPQKREPYTVDHAYSPQSLGGTGLIIEYDGTEPEVVELKVKEEEIPVAV